jgi:type II secretory pathway component PulF
LLQVLLDIVRGLEHLHSLNIMHSGVTLYHSLRNVTNTCYNIVTLQVLLDIARALEHLHSLNIMHSGATLLL